MFLELSAGDQDLVGRLRSAAGAERLLVDGIPVCERNVVGEPRAPVADIPVDGTEPDREPRFEGDPGAVAVINSIPPSGGVEVLPVQADALVAHPEEIVVVEGDAERLGLRPAGGDLCSVNFPTPAGVRTPVHGNLFGEGLVAEPPYVEELEDHLSATGVHIRLKDPPEHRCGLLDPADHRERLEVDREEPVRVGAADRFRDHRLGVDDFRGFVLVGRLVDPCLEDLGRNVVGPGGLHRPQLVLGHVGARGLVGRLLAPRRGVVPPLALVRVHLGLVGSLVQHRVVPGLGDHAEDLVHGVEGLDRALLHVNDGSVGVVVGIGRQRQRPHGGTYPCGGARSALGLRVHDADLLCDRQGTRRAWATGPGTAPASACSQNTRKKNPQCQKARNLVHFASPFPEGMPGGFLSPTSSNCLYRQEIGKLYRRRMSTI